MSYCKMNFNPIGREECKPAAQQITKIRVFRYEDVRLHQHNGEIDINPSAIAPYETSAYRMFEGRHLDLYVDGCGVAWVPNLIVGDYGRRYEFRRREIPRDQPHIHEWLENYHTIMRSALRHFKTRTVPSVEDVCAKWNRIACANDGITERVYLCHRDDITGIVRNDGEPFIKMVDGRKFYSYTGTVNQDVTSEKHWPRKVVLSKFVNSKTFTHEVEFKFDFSETIKLFTDLKKAVEEFVANGKSKVVPWPSGGVVPHERGSSYPQMVLDMWNLNKTPEKIEEYILRNNVGNYRDHIRAAGTWIDFNPKPTDWMKEFVSEPFLFKKGMIVRCVPEVTPFGGGTKTAHPVDALTGSSMSERADFVIARDQLKSHHNIQIRPLHRRDDPCYDIFIESKYLRLKAL